MTDDEMEERKVCGWRCLKIGLHFELYIVGGRAVYMFTAWAGNRLLYFIVPKLYFWNLGFSLTGERAAYAHYPHRAAGLGG